jgi:hypothetical protein
MRPSQALIGAQVEPLDETRAKATGLIAGRAATTDIVDACVVEGALRRQDLVVSGDERDLRAIAAAVGQRLGTDHP